MLVHVRSSTRVKDAFPYEGQGSCRTCPGPFCHSSKNGLVCWSLGKSSLQQALVQTHSSNKVARNQSLPGIVPQYRQVKCISSASLFVSMKKME